MIAKLSSDYNPDPEKLLNINGYYLPYVDSTKLILCGYGPQAPGYVFRVDGSVDLVYFNLKSYHENIDSIDIATLYKNNNIEIKGCIGIYKILDGELILDEIRLSNYSGIKKWYTDRFYMKILNDTTLFNYKDRLGDSGTLVPRNLYFKFFPTIDSLVMTYGQDRTKERKWMWADKKDWKEYKRKVKEYNDSLKHLSGK